MDGSGCKEKGWRRQEDTRPSHGGIAKNFCFGRILGFWSACSKKISTINSD